MTTLKYILVFWVLCSLQVCFVLALTSFIKMTNERGSRMEQNDIDFKIVGKNLRRIMAEKNFTFPQMSRITNVPLNSLRGYMYCTSYPTSKQIQKIAKGLRIEVAELFRE